MEFDNPNKLNTIVVDLTAVLPGGENGGAKVFVLELLRRLSEGAPRTNFVLLTRLSAHQELATLDRANIQRVVAVDDDKRVTIRSMAARTFSNLIGYLPPRLRVTARAFLNRLKKLEQQQRTVASSVDKLKADLLFCPFTAINFLDLEIPTVAVFYDLQHNAYSEFFTAEEVAQRDAIFFDACRRSTILVAISDYSRQAAIGHGKLDPARIKTIHLQISQHSLRNAPRDEDILQRLQLQHGLYLIYPANFWPHKNHERLFAAFAVALRTGLPNDIRLVCTGAPGPRQDQLKQTAHGMGLGGHILFTGYISTAELLTTLSSSAGMIFPSLYEGFGLPVIEAMACGVPVACSNVTSLPEVAGGSAILFDPTVVDEIAQAMIALVKSTEITSKLVTLGSIRAADFSSSRLMAEQYWETFQQAARAARQPEHLADSGKATL